MLHKVRQINMHRLLLFSGAGGLGPNIIISISWFEAMICQIDKYTWPKKQHYKCPRYFRIRIFKISFINIPY